MKKFVTDWLASWSGGNAEKLLSFYHPDIFYRDPAFPQGIQGKENLGKYLTKLLAKYPDWKWTLLHMDEVWPERFYIKWHAQINEVQEEGLDLVLIKDNQIIRNEVYFDPTRLIKRG